MVLLIQCAFADPVGGNITASADNGQLPSASPDAFNVTAGNVTQINLSTEASTYRWTGIYGNVTGNIKLGDSGSNVLYEWVARGRYVYASTSPTIDWSSMAAASISDVLGEYGFLGVNSVDNYSQTFPFTATFYSDVIGNLTNVNYTLTLNSSGGPTWETYSLTDGAEIVFAGQVHADGNNSYSNELVNYQMIIPEDGTLSNVQPTEYNFWVELI
ncbi:MAG TPA: hypothetical protein VK158_03010 [Acidobacteriota bacterium]|nr:hypothetical protein [Acidobacteriota bacterium]